MVTFKVSIIGWLVILSLAQAYAAEPKSPASKDSPQTAESNEWGQFTLIGVERRADWIDKSSLSGLRFGAGPGKTLAVVFIKMAPASGNIAPFFSPDLIDLDNNTYKSEISMVSLGVAKGNQGLTAPTQSTILAFPYIVPTSARLGRIRKGDVLLDLKELKSGQCRLTNVSTPIPPAVLECPEN